MDYFVTDYGADCSVGAECAVLEDSIMQKGCPVTAGSKILEGYNSPIDATVVARLEAAGIVILGKTKMDEFGIGGLFSGAQKEAPGAVSAVADGVAAFALCNDYTGSVRQQAAMRGVCYIHPTYGTISRYGLIPAVPSMDQIGIVCKYPADGERLLPIIAGYDAKDGAMLMHGVHKAGCRKQNAGCKEQEMEGREESNSGSGTRNSEYRKAELRIGVPRNVIDQVSGKSEVLEFVKDFCCLVSGDINNKPEDFVENPKSRIQSSEFTEAACLCAVDIELKYFDAYAQVMRVLCCAELSGNLSRYDGVKFGYRADSFSDLHELYTKSRSEGFGPDIKLAAIMGAMALSQENYTKYYDKALRIRRLIKESLEFNKYDAIIMPVFGEAPDEALALSALPQLCGLPAVTVPFKSGGIMLIADINQENVLFSVLKTMKTSNFTEPCA